MDIHNQCLSVFKSFINDITKVYPEYQDTIQETYGSILSIDSCTIEDNELLTEFLERVHKLNKKITNKDETLFIEDSLILTNISSKEMWSQKISYKTKETIWKYLQTFCLLALNHQSNQELQNALSSLNDNKTIEITDKKIASDVKKIKKMSENIQEPIAEDMSTNEESAPESSDEPNPFSNMDNLLNGSEIGKIAKQVSETIDIESLLGGGSDNPMDMLQNLMSGDAIGKIMGTIHNVVNEKVESGTLNENDMVSEAEGLYKNMGDNPFFQAMNNMGQKQQHQQPKPSNKTKARLQKKLKEKQKLQVNKVE